MRSGSHQRPTKSQPVARPPRRPWLALAATWLLLALLIVLHTRAVLEYVRFLDGLGPGGTSEARTPMRQVVPAHYSDAQTWARLLLDAGENRDARIRFTTSDNAPVGREVHWSSAFAWLLRGAAALQRSISGETPARALEQTLHWFNAPLLLVLIVPLSVWVARRAGVGAGIVIALGMVGHHRIYGGFTPTYVDHHGVVSASLLGLVLGAIFMGAGWWRPAAANSSTTLPVSRDRARRAAIVSALCGAFGLWVSAAAILPAIALVGISGVVILHWARSDAQRSGATFDPSIWQVWGRVGAVASAAFYLLEYAPSHLSLRLEVNHPLWSLAWWGGAELVARASQPWSEVSRAKARLVLPLLAIAAAPLAIIIGGTSTFMVSDPFVADLRHYVAEGMSLPAIVRQKGLTPFRYDFVALLILVPTGIVLAKRRDEARIIVGLLGLVTVAFTLMAFAEIRWWSNAAAAELALLVALIATLPKRSWLPIAAVAALFIAAAAQRIIVDRGENRRQAVTATDLMQPLYRDIAAVLRDSQPAGEIILLADPNGSAGISYFGRFKSIGTLYWENAPGLRAAAEIICARSDDEAARLVRARGITHVAIISTANFIGEYFRLLNPHGDRAEIEKCFGVRATRETPRWLQPIPYKIPTELKSASQFVSLFKVAFDQSEVDRLYHTAIARAAAGQLDAAEDALTGAVRQAPATAHFSLYESAASAFYEFGSDALAARTFQRALALQNDPMAANTLAWILATSSDAGVRNGRAALALVESRVRTEPNDPTLLSTFAAACAEVGRFPDAISAAERALAVVRTAGDQTAAALLARRLESYRAGRPWRQ
jgi:tetratricopeptide (TPR) repeat protein